MARRVAKYIYAKCILDQVNTIISEKCEGCQEDYPSQRDHECLYYGDTPVGQREVIGRHFRKAARRVNMPLVQKSIVAIAEMCDIKLNSTCPFGFIDLEDLLELLYFRWGEDPEGCFTALSDNLSVHGMILCNDVIAVVSSKIDSADK